MGNAGANTSSGGAAGAADIGSGGSPIGPAPAAPVERPLVSLARIEAENMTVAGPYAGVVSDPLAGVGLYGGEDAVSFVFTFPTIPGLYRFEVTGASSSAATARAELLLDAASRASFSFAGVEPGVQAADFVIASGAPEQNVTLRAVGDDGSWDLYIDRVEVFYRGEPDPPLPAPNPPEAPLAESGVYRNLFVELGKSEAEVDARVEQVVSQLFYGNEEERIYYEAGSDEAYIFTADTDDVRSEGMSYGMMFSVQLDKRAEFDRLWKFAKTHMQHASGDRTGYFAWRLRTDGTHLDANPAPDGEEYFAAALLMAARRWGNGAGIYDYDTEANLILDHMLHHRALTGLPEFSGIADMIDPTEKQVVFSIEGQSATFTDPSYHLPHFYELFAKWAARDREVWLEVAATSRQLFQAATHVETGLAPDYSEFDGTPTGGTHAQFRFDAWRVAMNITLDSAWWNKDAWQRTTWVGNYLGFFAAQGISTYRNQFNIDGTGAEGDHSPGLVAMNAVAALISRQDVAWEFVDELWKTNPTTGRYRYYDGCIYLFGLLNVTGRYRIIGLEPTVSQPG
jgi:endo-1,4-beta-D-glucanase Y